MVLGVPRTLESGAFVNEVIVQRGKAVLRDQNGLVVLECNSGRKTFEREVIHANESREKTVSQTQRYVIGLLPRKD